MNMKFKPMNKNTLFLTLIFWLAAVSQSAFSAVCNFPSNVTLTAGSGFSGYYNLSGFAFSQYYFQTSSSGGFTPLSLQVQGFPGITNGSTNGFAGTGTTMGVFFFTHPNLSPGTQSQITIKIISLSGQTVCSGSFTATIGNPSGPTWTNWLNRDGAGGSGDWEARSLFSPSEVCEYPTDIEARRVGTSAAFSVNDPWPEIFSQFSAQQGLVCLNADQVDNSCNNYEVRFLCP